MIEHKIHIGATRVGIRIVGRNLGHASAATDLNALIPLLFLDRAPIDLKVNTIVLNNDGADASLVARLSRRSPHGHHLLQLLTTR